MDVYLDDEVLDAPAMTLGGMIDQARNRAGRDGRLVVEIRFDGEVLDDEQIRACRDDAPQADEIQFITANPHSLAISALEDVRHSLDAARSEQRAAAEAFATDDTTQGLDHVGRALSHWHQTQTAVRQSAALLDIALDALRTEAQPLSAIIENLVARLKEVRSRMADQDWIGLADTLAVELDDTAEQWERLIDVLTAHIEAQQRESD